MPYMLYISIIIFIVFIIILFFLFQRIEENKNKELLQSVTGLYRGDRAELNLVLKLLKSGISEKAIFHDLYVEKGNGKFAQVDVVVATKVGIIVFEVKDYSGWIFGNGKHQKWTKVLAYGDEKYRFYNPIIQNKKHIEALKRKSSQFYKLPFYSVIVFYGNCQLRDISFVPEETFIVTSDGVLAVVEAILNSYKPAEYTNKHEVIRILKTAVANGDDTKIVEQHITNVQNALGNNRAFK